MLPLSFGRGSFYFFNPYKINLEPAANAPLSDFSVNVRSREKAKFGVHKVLSKVENTLRLVSPPVSHSTIV